MVITPEQKALLTLEATISAYKCYAQGDPFKSTRMEDWEKAAKALREHLMKEEAKA